jgi:hypothetical protein
MVPVTISLGVNYMDSTKWLNLKITGCPSKASIDFTVWHLTALIPIKYLESFSSVGVILQDGVPQCHCWSQLLLIASIISSYLSSLWQHVFGAGIGQVRRVWFKKFIIDLCGVTRGKANGAE